MSCKYCSHLSHLDCFLSYTTFSFPSTQQLLHFLSHLLNVLWTYYYLSPKLPSGATNASLCDNFLWHPGPSLSTAHHSCCQNEARASASAVWSQPPDSSLGLCSIGFPLPKLQRQSVPTPMMLVLACALLHVGLACLEHPSLSPIPVLSHCSSESLPKSPEKPTWTSDACAAFLTWGFLSPLGISESDPKWLSWHITSWLDSCITGWNYQSAGGKSNSKRETVLALWNSDSSCLPAQSLRPTTKGRQGQHHAWSHSPHLQPTSTGQAACLVR